MNLTCSLVWPIAYACLTTDIGFAQYKAKRLRVSARLSCDYLGVTLCLFMETVEVEAVTRQHEVHAVE